MDVKDLVSSALDSKPVDFESAFKEIIMPKLQAAIETKKQEIAQALFNRPEEPEEEEVVDGEGS